ncbi:cation:proton antiporter [Hyphococcus lacteus]|uniref:Sodium:proton antiporter n=1 Tax=Hyphococcus lacteus TaxID=3143536 RepID=A0ABV3Z0I0_9PROT
MLQPIDLGLILIAVLVFAAFSRRLEASVITMPMVFVTFGWLIGLSGIELVPMGAEREIIHVIAEVTLALVLFSDASRVNFKFLEQNFTIPIRMLLIGMPLTIGFGTIVAYWVSPDQPWAFALLVAAILTPTDAALGQAVVNNQRVPERLREGINVESGLNDGLALPVVMVAAIAVVQLAGKSIEGAPDNLAMFALMQVVLGPIAGLFVGYVTARLLDVAVSNGFATTAYQGIYFLCAAFLCAVFANMIGGNSLIAAFIGGLVFGATLKCSRQFITEFMESEGQILTMLTFLIFGAVMVPIGLSHATWKTFVLSVAFLTIVRMVPIWISLTGAGLNFEEKAFLGWFGPRGLASILFALLIVENYPVPGADEMLACVVLTVIMSIFAHGISATPLSSRLTKNNSHP